MPFKKKGATAATATATATVPAPASATTTAVVEGSVGEVSSYDLGRLIDSMKDELVNSGIGVIDLPSDAEFLSSWPDLAEGLKVVAERMGVTGYDPSKTSTFGMYQREKDGAVVVTAPRLVSPDGEKVILEWGDIEHEIPGNTVLRGSTDWMTALNRQGDKARVDLTFGPGRPGKPGTLNFPVGMFINEEHRDSQDEIPLLQTFSELAEFLGSAGSKLMKFSDLGDGSTFQVTEFEERIGKSSGNPYGVLTVESDGEVAKFFAPGKPEDWSGMALPIAATKEGYSLVLGDGSKISIGGFLSCDQLEIGRSYPAIGYLIKEVQGKNGRFKSSVLYLDIDGARVPVNGNYSTTNTLLSATFGGVVDEVEHDIDAVFVVDSVSSVDQSSNKNLVTITSEDQRNLISGDQKLRAKTRLQSNDAKSQELRSKLLAFKNSAA